MKKYLVFDYDSINSKWWGPTESPIKPTKESLPRQSESTIIFFVEVPYMDNWIFIKGEKKDFDKLPIEQQTELKNEITKLKVYKNI